MWINQVHLLERKHSAHDKLIFWISACDLNLSFASLLAGKSVWGVGSLAIGSALAWESNVTMKYRLILFNHDIECSYVDKGKI